MFKKLNNIGDCGIVCDFGDEVNRSTNASVIKLFHHIKKEVSEGNLDGILNYTPSYNKLIIIFDLKKINSSIKDIPGPVSKPMTSLRLDFVFI